MRTSGKLLLPALFVLALAPLATAQDEKPARRLESITWNPANHKLTWTVAQGKVGTDGKFVEAKKQSFEINMDEATMRAGTEGRRFSKQEAVSVHALMDLVAKYAAESTLWWDAGEGEPLDADSGKSKVKDREDDKTEPYFAPRPRRNESKSPKTLRIKYPL